PERTRIVMNPSRAPQQQIAAREGTPLVVKGKSRLQGRALGLCANPGSQSMPQPPRQEQLREMPVRLVHVTVPVRRHQNARRSENPGRIRRHDFSDLLPPTGARVQATNADRQRPALVDVQPPPIATPADNKFTRLRSKRIVNFAA